MTFGYRPGYIRPRYNPVGSIPSLPQLPSGQPSPAPVYEWVKENPEVVHHAAIGIGTQLVPPGPSRLLARAVFQVAHYAGHLIWDRSTHLFPSSESPTSSSSSSQQNGGVGGTGAPRTFPYYYKNMGALPSGSRVMKPMWKTTSRHPHGGVKSGHHYCKKGWLVIKVGDTHMCWKIPRKK